MIKCFTIMPSSFEKIKLRYKTENVNILSFLLKCSFNARDIHKRSITEFRVYNILKVCEQKLLLDPSCVPEMARLLREFVYSEITQSFTIFICNHLNLVYFLTKNTLSVWKIIFMNYNWVLWVMLCLIAVYFPIQSQKNLWCTKSFV